MARGFKWSILHRLGWPALFRQQIHDLTRKTHDIKSLAISDRIKSAPDDNQLVGRYDEQILASVAARRVAAWWQSLFRPIELELRAIANAIVPHRLGWGWHRNKG
jgi:hypothetical protein